MQEQWLPVIGYEELYEVSNFGKVRCIKKYKPSCRKKNVIKRNNILVNAINKSGYVRLCLNKDGISKSFKLSRLVAIHFIPNPDNLPYVNHIDGNKINDIYTNLEWCSQADNVKHAYKTGLRFRSIGSKRPTYLSFDIANEIREIYKNREKNQREIAELYNVSTATINGIINFKIWYK